MAIKVFHPGNTDVAGWRDKINFVDTNNCGVGFDFADKCCESFGFYFASSPDCVDYSDGDDNRGISYTMYNLDSMTWPDLSDYTFDPGFFKLIDNAYCDDSGRYNNYAMFRLCSDSADCLYLVLYNHHNGYYAHGFKFTDGADCINAGTL